MLLAWMAYAVVFGALTYVAAIATEHVAAMWSRRRRLIWVVALTLASGAQVALAPLPQSARDRTSDLAASFTAPNDVAIVSIAGPKGMPAHGSARAKVARFVGLADEYAPHAWALASFGWIAFLVWAAIGVRRRRAHWRAIEIDGVGVLVSPTTGPAVVGAVAPRVVIPAWALSLDARARALMLRHEAEHIRARDPLLLMGATLAIALFPWNAALWLLVRRLRLAIEIDCDERVLRALAHRREYAELLLTVGARRSAPLAFVAPLAERRPLLERRIRAMTSIPPRYPRLVVTASVALVAVATIAAARTPRPASLSKRVIPAAVPRSRPVGAPVAVAVPAMASAAGATATAATAISKPTPAARKAAGANPLGVRAPAGPRASGVRGPDSLTVEWIRAMIAAHHPSALAGDPGINTVTLIVDAQGNYVVSTAELRPALNGAGSGARGRSGGPPPELAGGGGFARGRVGGGASGGAAEDSAGTQARLVEMKTLLAKLASMFADTIVYRQELAPPHVIAGGMTVRADSINGLTAHVKTMLAGYGAGLNMDVISRLVDPERIKAITRQTFAPGELGTTWLRVFVVRLAP